MHPHPRHPGTRYFNAWRRRTGKLLAPCGSLREAALLLSRTQGHSPTHWENRLRRVLDGSIVPDIDELTAIDAILARPLCDDETWSVSDLFPDSPGE
jgi:hypothetical protein